MQVTRLIQGKSSVDQRIAIDAVDILHAGRVGTIALVTNDTDFVPLLHRLREGNIYTVLIGDQRAPPGLRGAAHEFHELPASLGTPQVLTVQSTITATAKATVRNATPEDVLPELEAAFNETARNGIAHLGALGASIKKRMPNFNPKDYGEKRLLDLFEKFPHKFTVLHEERGEHGPVHYIRRKED